MCCITIFLTHCFCKDFYRKDKVCARELIVFVNLLGSTSTKILSLPTEYFKVKLFLQDHRIKPGSYFLRILTSQGRFRSECFAGVEHISTAAKYSLRICDVNFRIRIRIRRKYEPGFTHSVSPLVIGY